MKTYKIGIDDFLCTTVHFCIQYKTNSYNTNSFISNQGQNDQSQVHKKEKKELLMYKERHNTP